MSLRLANERLVVGRRGLIVAGPGRNMAALWPDYPVSLSVTPTFPSPGVEQIVVTASNSNGAIVGTSTTNVAANPALIPYVAQALAITGRKTLYMGTYYYYITLEGGLIINPFIPGSPINLVLSPPNTPYANSTQNVAIVTLTQTGTGPGLNGSAADLVGLAGGSITYSAPVPTSPPFTSLPVMIQAYGGGGHYSFSLTLTNINGSATLSASCSIPA